jgi:shikimate kinase
MPSSPACDAAEPGRGDRTGIGEDAAGVGAIVLVGMMATGKTSVARQLGRRLRRQVYDSDAMIVARTGRTVAQLWEAGGEPAFRDLETAVLDEALDERPPGVVAAAGGVVLSAANRARLRRASEEGAVVVWLRADPGVLARRIRPGDHRPLLAQDPAGTLARLTAERQALYAAVADRTVDTGTAPFTQVVEEVLSAVRAVAGEREHAGGAGR